jgi:hypothetical protein
MDSHEVAQQMQVEHGLLRHLIQGLRATAAWEVPGPDASRKLSTLRFVAGSFQRHLERPLALEEYDGWAAQCKRPSGRQRVSGVRRRTSDRRQATMRQVRSRG